MCVETSREMSSKFCGKCGDTLFHDTDGVLCFQCLAANALKFFNESFAATTIGKVTALSGESRFGDYEIIEEIARGGMGVVFKARQLSQDRIVALKLIHSGPLSSLRSEARFLAEIEAVATLDHPHIVRILDAGTQDEMPFYTMKLVDGGSLAARQNRLFDKAGPRELVQRLVKVAHAVHYAHEHGIIHRDLKPSNVLLDSTGEPHVSDFGLAKRVDEQTELTFSGEILGTPAFMAPEQASGPPSLQTIAVDVYGLGAILFHCLCGRAPFVGKTALDILRKLETEDVVSPIAIRSSVDRDLAVITLKCLERDPRRRYVSALELAEDLERWLRNEPILARASSYREKLSKWSRRRPYAALALGVTGFFVSLLILQQGASYRRSLAEQTRTQIAQDRLVKTLTVSRVQRADDLVVAGRNGEAIANLAANLRDRPERLDSLSYLMSLIESQPFANQLGPSLKHRSDVWGVAFHPDGKRVATACYDNAGRIWSIETGTLTVPPLKHSKEVYRIDFSLDGKRVLTGSYDGTARVWDADTGEFISPALKHDGGLQVAYFDPVTQHIITSGADCVVRIWNGDGLGPPLRELIHDPKEGAIHVARRVPGENLMITASVRGHLWIWDLVSGQQLRELPSGFDYLSDVVMNPMGDRFLVLGQQNIGLWSTDSWQRKTLLPHGSTAWSAAFSDRGDRLATADAADVAIWNSINGNRIATLAHVGDSVSRTRASGDGDSFLFFNHNTISFFGYKPLRPRYPAIVMPFTVQDVYPGRDGRRLAVATKDRSITIWGLSEKVPSLPIYRTPEGQTADMVGFVLDLDGSSRLVFGDSGDSHIQVVSFLTPDAEPNRIDVGEKIQGFGEQPVGKWLEFYTVDSSKINLVDPESGKLNRIEQVSRNARADLSSDQQWLATQQVTGSELRLYSVPESRFVGAAMGLEKGLLSRQISPDSQLLAIGTNLGGIAVWRVKDQQRVGKVDGEWGGTQALAWAPTSDRLATGSEDGVLRLFRVNDQVAPEWEMGLNAAVRQVCFNPAGTQVISGTINGLIAVWDARTGERLTEEMGHDAEILRLEVDSKGRVLLAVSRDQTYRFWDLRSGTALTESLPWRGQNGLVRLSPDGIYYTCSRSDGGVELRPVPQPQTIDPPIPSWFPRFVEALGGIRLDLNDRIELLPWEERVTIIDQIRQMGTSTPLLRWTQSVIPDGGWEPRGSPEKEPRP